MVEPLGEGEWGALVARCYGRQGFSLESPPGAGALAAALLGPAAIRYVAPLELDEDAVLRPKPWGPCIEVRANLPAPLENYAVARALAEWVLARGTYPPSTIAAFRARLAATLLVPKPALALHWPVRTSFEALEELAEAFLVPQALMALRLGECFGVPTALVGPRGRVKRRGAEGVLPSDFVLVSLARAPEMLPHVPRFALSDAPGFVVFQAEAEWRAVWEVAGQMTKLRTDFWSHVAPGTICQAKESSPMSTIPPLVRKIGLNADLGELRPLLATTPRVQAAYEGFAERLAVDAEFYSLRAIDPLLSSADRERCRRLADTLWREHEVAKTAAEAVANYGSLLRSESAALAHPHGLAGRQVPPSSRGTDHAAPQGGPVLQKPVGGGVAADVNDVELEDDPRGQGMPLQFEHAAVLPRDPSDVPHAPQLGQRVGRVASLLGARASLSALRSLWQAEDVSPLACQALPARVPSHSSRGVPTPEELRLHTSHADVRPVVQVEPVSSELSDRRLNIRVKSSDLDLLAALAKAIGLNKTDVVRLALRQLAVERGIDPDDPRKRRPAPVGPTVPAGAGAEPVPSLLGIARLASTTAEAATEVARVTGWSLDVAATFAKGARAAVESPPPPPASPPAGSKGAPKGSPRRRSAPAGADAEPGPQARPPRRARSLAPKKSKPSG